MNNPISESAFLPGAREFEFQALTDTVFMNHPHARGEDAYIIGNISSTPAALSIPRDVDMVDALTGTRYAVNSEGMINLNLEPYGALWLKHPTESP